MIRRMTSVSFFEDWGENELIGCLIETTAKGAIEISCMLKLLMNLGRLK